uniref:Receptor ligand binding region domain-containing protein n=1 Tax=Anopheles farauti TaxID=69004 RepID=A0A182QJ32_9DIPT
MSVRANDLGRAAVRCSVMLLFVLASTVPGRDRTSLVRASIDVPTPSASSTPTLANSTSYRHQSVVDSLRAPGFASPLPPAVKVTTPPPAPSYGTFVNRTSRDLVASGASRDCEHTRVNVTGGGANRGAGPETDAPGNFLKFAILLPKQPNKRRDIRILSTVLPVIEMATRVVTAPGGLLQKFRIEIDHRDTQCSSTYGALGAFDIFLTRKPDVFFGPICDYVIAPISRYSSVWGIPVITTGGLTEAFTLKVPNYRTLTRMTGNYHAFGLMMREIHRHYNWTIQAYLYHEWDEKSGLGFTDCSMALTSINRAIGGNETSYWSSFDEETAQHADYVRKLRKIGERARKRRAKLFLFYLGMDESA